ncbi:hypothetical protein [Actinoplanes regularis]|uniref:hypothetical protein n=1 Tax=Actinoplanes regularis TaxID=52697 RepID=UPI0024A4A262|nr:hypothetical protein [Actinoplanes regularis]GLW32301.1 hypothetical protein Areg01_52400 [Actinoplanes regularis]
MTMLSLKSRPVRRLARRVLLAGLPCDAAGRPLTIAVVSRIAWVLAYALGLAALIPSVEHGYSPAVGVLALISAVAGITGMAADLMKPAVT